MEVIDQKLNALIAAYDKLICGIDSEAMESQERAYGGIVRAGKGKLVENLATELVKIAWLDVLKQNRDRLDINKKKIPVKVKESYILNMNDKIIKDYLLANKHKLIYKFGTDVHVYIDNELLLPIECKAYTENAMMKRILFDAELMKEAKNINTYFLFQLESQLGGDISQLNETTFGSASTHVLMSHTDVELKVITLLKGERAVEKPIHKKEFYKPLKKKELQKALNIFTKALEVKAI